jgi:hypothetical protein
MPAEVGAAIERVGELMIRDVCPGTGVPTPLFGRFLAQPRGNNIERLRTQ